MDIFTEESSMERMIIEQEKLSDTERVIADFFLNNKEKLNFSSARIAKKIHVSEASLSRFAQKMGYHGYREFIYQYQREFDRQEEGMDLEMESVFASYHGILNKSHSRIDQEQMNRIVSLLMEKKKIFVYGFGSSGIAGEEFVLRLLRLGVDAKVITELHQMVINENQLNSDVLAIGISLSGETLEILDAMSKASRKGAKTILITSNEQMKSMGYTEVVITATQKNLELGNIVSPQLPILIILDLIFVKFLAQRKADVEQGDELWKRIKTYHVKE